MLILTKRIYVEREINKSMKKFTEAQKNALTLLYEKESADYYDILRVGANAGTMKKLMDSGLVSKIDAPGYSEWQITIAGRFAKENEFLHENMLKVAFLLLIGKINEGFDFPDAIYHVSTKYCIDAKMLEKMYEKMYDEDFLAVNCANRMRD